jgi:membrane protease YdiL (CAAX protease family)
LDTHLLNQARDVLRRSPGSRGLLYLGAAVVLFEGVGRQFDRRSPTEVLYVHLTVLPLGVALTAAFRRLEGASWWQVPPAQGAKLALAGIGLGSAAFLSVGGIAAAQGWASAPAWGWSQTSAGSLLGSVAFLSVSHLAVAGNEELVFRGYGLDTLRAAIGPAGAALILTALFALFHERRPQVLLGQALLGAALMALRLRSGSLWMPIGYHWAWNIMQTAVLGPADAAPSLRPLVVDGPAQWVGRPGHPEPGLLSILVNAAVVVAIGLTWWWERRRLVNQAHTALGTRE